MKCPTKCRKCGRDILLMDTYKGTRMPVDRKPVQFIIGGRQERRFVTEERDVYRGEIAGDGEAEHDRITGYACHYDTCGAK